MKLSATIVAVSFLLSSCSFFSTSKKISTISKLKEGLEKVCLSAEGKGRIQYSGTKYVFALESLLEDELWSLGLQIPAYGEEILRFDWSKADKNQVRILGSFFRRLKIQSRNIPNGKQQIKLLKQYILKLGLFLKLKSLASTEKLNNLCRVDQANSFEESGVCKIGKSEIKFIFKDQHLYFDFVLGKKNLRLDLFDAAPHYRRFSIYESEVKSGNKVKSPISMDLFLTTCAKEAL